jgi:type II secretory pathway component GspD/PulD (secretin)
MLVPVLRPMIGQNGHMAATNNNKLILVDHYDNIRRLTAIINEIVD